MTQMMTTELEQLKKKWRAPFSFLPSPYIGFEVADVKIEFNPKMRSRAGVCKLNIVRASFRTAVRGSIELNPHLLTNVTSLEEVLVHELCHYVIGIRWPRAEPHGQKWRELMVMMGFEPKRCHDMKPVKQNRQKRWPLQCGCQTHEVTTIIFNRIANGTRYKCRKCGDFLAKSQGAK